MLATWRRAVKVSPARKPPFFAPKCSEAVERMALTKLWRQCWSI